ncbi:nitroreductase protein [Rutstroemia sp. NJR-2017a BVV2]|nr:nitroreductase protein [Rutstroemia sp. NJR-2017a BVV2]
MPYATDITSTKTVVVENTDTQDISQKSNLTTHPQMTLDETLLIRHTSRGFLPTPVPQSILHSTLELAQHAPSNSNIQPHRVFILTGDSLLKLETALYAVASETSPNIPALPEEFQHFRRDLGYQVYNEGMGILRTDHAARNAAVLRNYKFFDAPCAAIVCIDRRLSAPDVLGVGMWLQSWLLALTEQGVQSAVEVSVAGYPEVVRRECGIGEELEVLCGVAVGYEDLGFKPNFLRSGRTPVEANVTFLV